MAKEVKHLALPRLYGAPATARPAPVAKEAPRPFDPDQMPIVADLTDDEREFVQTLPPHAFLPGGGYILGSEDRGRDGGPKRRRMPFFLRALTSRLFGSS
ncbi:MAG: hypothetical protein M3R57_06800 [Chloroflexota bacterium]|nr:hypothetical protein [Chloroflexota bacterium]